MNPAGRAKARERDQLTHCYGSGSAAPRTPQHAHSPAGAAAASKLPTSGHSPTGAALPTSSPTYAQAVLSARTRTGASSHVAKTIRTDSARVDLTPPSAASRTSLTSFKPKPAVLQYSHIKVVQDKDQSGRCCVVCGRDHSSTTCASPTTAAGEPTRVQYVRQGNRLVEFATGKRVCFEFNGYRYTDFACTGNSTCPKTDDCHVCSLCVGNGDDGHRAIDCPRANAVAKRAGSRTSTGFVKASVVHARSTATATATVLSTLPTSRVGTPTPTSKTVASGHASASPVATTSRRTVPTASPVAAAGGAAAAGPRGFADLVAWQQDRAAAKSLKNKNRVGVKKLLYLDKFETIRKNGFQPPQVTHRNATPHGFDFNNAQYKTLAALPPPAEFPPVVETPTVHRYNLDVPAAVLPRPGYVAYLTSDVFLPQVPEAIRTRVAKVLRSVQERTISSEDVTRGLAEQRAKDDAFALSANDALSGFGFTDAQRSWPQFKISADKSLQRTDGITHMSSLHVQLHYPPACANSRFDLVLNGWIDGGNFICSTGLAAPQHTLSYRVSAQNTNPHFLEVDVETGGDGGAGARFRGTTAVGGANVSQGAKFPAEVATAFKHLRAKDLLSRIDSGISQAAAYVGALNAKLVGDVAKKARSANAERARKRSPPEYIVHEWQWQGRSPRLWEAGVPCVELVSVRAHVLDRPGQVFGPTDRLFSYSKSAEAGETASHVKDLKIDFTFVGLATGDGGIVIASLPHPSVSRTKVAVRNVAYASCAALDLGLTWLEGLHQGTFFGGAREPPLWKAFNTRWRTNFMSTRTSTFMVSLAASMKDWEAENNMLIPRDALPRLLRGVLDDFTVTEVAEGQDGIAGVELEMDPGDHRGLVAIHVAKRFNYIGRAKSAANPLPRNKYDTPANRAQFAGVQAAKMAAQDKSTTMYERGDDYEATCSCGILRIANQYVRNSGGKVPLVMHRKVSTSDHPEPQVQGRAYCHVGIPLEQRLYTAAKSHDKASGTAKDPSATIRSEWSMARQKALRTRHAQRTSTGAPAGFAS